MRIVVCPNPAPDLKEIDGKYDLAIVCGICPLFDNHLVTWNVINSIDWIDGKFNSWLKNIDATVKVVTASPYDFVAEFYGSQLSYYLAGEYLQDDTVSFKGLNIYAMPWYMPHMPHVPGHGVRAFKARNSELMNVAIDSIPDETDILICNTHEHMCKGDVLPYFHGDSRLLERLDSLKRLKLFIHTNTACDFEQAQQRKYLTLCASHETIGSSTVVNM